VRYTLIRDGVESSFELERTEDGALRIRSEDGDWLVDDHQLGNGRIHVLHECGSYDASLCLDGPTVDASIAGRHFRFEVYNERDLRLMRLETLTRGVADPEILSPMAGKIIDVPVSVGEMVSQGDSLMVIEAMKMENIIRAPHDGRVDVIDTQPGEIVEIGARLLVLTPDDPEKADE
jgi:biotin carboxyl carrier protein